MAAPESRLTWGLTLPWAAYILCVSEIRAYRHRHFGPLWDTLTGRHYLLQNSPPGWQRVCWSDIVLMASKDRRNEKHSKWADVGHCTWLSILREKIIGQGYITYGWRLGKWQVAWECGQWYSINDWTSRERSLNWRHIDEHLGIGTMYLCVISEPESDYHGKGTE